ACGASRTVEDAGKERAVERGPAVIEVEGDPNGIHWDASARVLYIADDDNNRILRWSDKGGIELVAALPAVPGGSAGLGQVVRAPDGTLVVPRFGGGTAGDVVYVDAEGNTGVVSGLDPTRK